MQLVAKRKPGNDEGSGFGSRLRAIRKERGLTLEQLGDLLEMHFTAISRIERGQHEPGWPIVLKLADALGVTPDAFLRSPEEGPGEPDDETENDHRDLPKPRPRGK